MSDNNGFWDKVKDRAYLNYLNRVKNNIPGSESSDWESAELDQMIEEKVKEEAFLHYKSYGDYPVINWLVAQREIHERLNFLAFYLHESNINRSPIDNWKEAQRLYISQF